MSQSPDHLQQYTTEQFDADAIPYFQENRAWFDGLMWKAKLQIDGNDEFHIFYSGERYDDGLLASDGELPLVVWAQPVNGADKIVLFDERIHGYSAILVEKKTFASPAVQQYQDDNGNQVFRVYLWTNSSIDFEDEFETNGKGEILTLDDEYKPVDFLERNAYDYIGILLEAADGETVRIVDMELA